MKLTPTLPALSVFFASLTPAVSADIVWTGAMNSDIFEEANWDFSMSTVTTVDPNVPILDNVVFSNSTVAAEVPVIGGGQFRFEVGEGFTMTIDNSTVRSLGDDGFGCSAGTVVGIDILVINGAIFEPWFVVNMVHVDADATSSLRFGGGGNPVNLSTVDVSVGTAFSFMQEDAMAFINEHLNKVTVDGAPAVLGQNLMVVDDGMGGCIVTALVQTIGTNYCMANVNSTGVPATISALGSTAVATNDVTLMTEDMPQNSFSFYITSQTQGFVMNPAGSAGNLCLGGSIGRYVGAGQIQQAGAMGTISLTLDLTNVPQPMGFVAAQAGETWSFQTWYRDSSPAGPTSNFSDGLAISFI